MKEGEVVYLDNIKPFSKRIWLLLYPRLIIPLIVLVLPLGNLNDANSIYIIWITIVLSTILLMFVSCYRWASSKIASITFRDDYFEIKSVAKDNELTFKISKKNIRTNLKWQGGRPSILILTLFDCDEQLIEIYSGGKQKFENQLDEIAEKINRYKTEPIKSLIQREK